MDTAYAYAMDAFLKCMLFLLGYLIAQFWNWAQRSLGKWAHYTLDSCKLNCIIVPLIYNIYFTVYNDKLNLFDKMIRFELIRERFLDGFILHP